MFEELHKITTENPNNKWNRAIFTLEPSGSFNIDFEWDQALADEIERLNNE
ncbi:immunity protein YezG family protein [Vibrio navarrensis]